MDRSAATELDPPCGPSFAAGLAQVVAGLDQILAAGVTPTDGHAARILVQAFESQARRIDAVRVKMVDAIDRSGTHRLDGHKSAKIMVRHLGRLSEATARTRDQSARALRRMPAMAAAFEAGLVSADQVAVIARAFANERIRTHVIDADDQLTALATDPGVDYRDFDRTVRDWADLMDQDGTTDRFQRTHRNRDLRIGQDYDKSWTITGGCAANDGAELSTIFDRFVAEQFELDWAEAKQRLGRDDISVADLARTPNQRRFDAMLEMARRAASTLPGQSGSQVVTNLMIDHRTFDHWLARYAAEFAGTPIITPADVSGFATDPAPADGLLPPGYRCESMNGHPIDPATAIAASLIGHVRRVVIDERSVVIDQSRKMRLFRDNAAIAARMTATTCYWPGCWVPVTDCQIDHLIPAADHGGPTDQKNAGPCCGHHNRLRNHGYRVERLGDGTLAVYRPDGTRIF